METAASANVFVDVKNNGQSVEKDIGKCEPQTDSEEVSQDKTHGSKHDCITKHDNSESQE